MFKGAYECMFLDMITYFYLQSVWSRVQDKRLSVLEVSCQIVLSVLIRLVLTSPGCIWNSGDQHILQVWQILQRIWVQKCKGWQGGSKNHATSSMSWHGGTRLLLLVWVRIVLCISMIRRLVMWVTVLMEVGILEVAWYINMCLTCHRGML